MEGSRNTLKCDVGRKLRGEKRHLGLDEHRLTNSGSVKKDFNSRGRLKTEAEKAILQNPPWRRKGKDREIKQQTTS